MIFSVTLSRGAVRELDRRASEEYGVPGLLLMEHAGFCATGALNELILGENRPRDGVSLAAALKKRTLVCCGKGNNAGDGFVLARTLDCSDRPVRVMVWAAPEELRGDAGINFQILRKAGVPIDFLGILGAQNDTAVLAERLAWADFVVDALLGTGAQGEPRPPLDAVIDQINASGKPVLAIDLPSGLDCDTGQPARHTIRAAATCTFVAAKQGFSAPGAEQFTGRVQVCPIGVPRKLLREFRIP